jgi:hypothetical protein
MALEHSRLKKIKEKMGAGIAEEPNPSRGEEEELSHNF